MNEIFVVAAIDTDWADGYFVKIDHTLPKPYTLTMLHKAQIFYSNEGAEECRTKVQAIYPNHTFRIYKYTLVGSYKPSKHNTNERRLDTEL